MRAVLEPVAVSPARYNAAMTRLLSLLFIALAAMPGLGCEQALFPPNLPRSQFERYTYQREGFTPQQEETVFGGTEIDLRSRLRPMSER